MGNKNLKEGLEKLNLSGVAVGNGLTDPEVQYQHYSEMAFKNSHNIKVISETTYESMKKAEPMCTKDIAKCNSGDSTIDQFACQAAFVYCEKALTGPFFATTMLCMSFDQINGDQPPSHLLPFLLNSLFLLRK